MTREEMAQDIEHVIVGAPFEDANARLFEIAAELRKTCATCQHCVPERELHILARRLHVAVIRSGLESIDRLVCRAWNNEPTHGSGYCHRHYPLKETT